jgi:hypothetical protein
MVKVKGKKVRQGVIDKYRTAIEDLRKNPGKYRSQEWCTTHKIGHSAARAMVQLGYARRINNRLHLQRERITDQMLISLVEKKREFDNLYKYTHTHTTLFRMPEMTQPERNAIEELADVELTFSAEQHERVGLVRRFIRWIW